ncbi:MAG: Transcriptional regulator, AraC family [uncultured Gemmatimonadaceae bacterium]|uniref:Transcriptional regulator, AraC family n=1 Tax=uncultured Gemmatimonadaceae bacterium TaxID=246130 RepID=A0A6J4LZ54_9BACT|nr:MAG: Transcriptional regulator, AraC family [uncultured Gemmatimonadaceae bacterium]
MTSPDPRRRRLEAGEFFGRTVAVRRVAGLVLVDSLHGAGLRVPRHEHEHAYLSVIRGGSFSETYGRRTRSPAPGVLLVNPPGEAHSERMDAHPVSSLNIELGAGWLRELFELGAPLDRPAAVRGEAIVPLGRRLLSEVTRTDGDSALAIESLTWEILHAGLGGCAFPADRARPRWLRDVRDLIDGALAGPPALGTLAREAGVHPVHFAVVFRRFYGCSLGEYARRRRLDAARSRLADPDASLSRIALDLGFADQSHFTRTFKRFTGMTPGQYRTFLGFKTR